MMKLLITIIFVCLTLISGNTSTQNGCEQCGLLAANSRIYMGKTMKANKYPWLVYMKIYDSVGSTRFSSCGGTVISKWNIITAAHCVVDNQNRKVSPSQIKVFLGAHSSKNLPQASKVASFQINYNPKDPSVDLAIIELESPISYSKTIAPICMMSGIGLNFTNGKLVTAGWGLTREGDKIPEYPSRLTLDHIPTGECQEKYNYFAKLHRQTPIKITDRLICAINRATGGDSCEGDSGGGLIYKNPQDGRYYLIGTVAGSVSECGQAHHPPGGYTNLAYHQDFIKKYTRLDCSSSAKSVQSSLPSSAQSTQQKTSQTTSSSIKYQKSSRSGIDSYDSDMELAEVIELMLYD